MRLTALTLSLFLLLGLSWAEEEPNPTPTPTPEQAEPEPEAEEKPHKTMKDIFGHMAEFLLPEDQIPNPLISKTPKKGLHHALMVAFVSDNFDSEMIMQTILSNMMDERRGFFKTAAFHCDEPTNIAWTEEEPEFPFCKEDLKDKTPILMLIKPPEYRVNPYTKKLAAPTVKLYQQEYKDFHPESVKKFLLDNLPDYTQNVEADRIESFASSKDMPALLLLSEKSKTGTLMKALSAEFKNRLNMGKVNVADAKPELIEELDIEEFPSFVLIDNKSGEKTLYTGQKKFRALRKYLNKFALQEEIDEDEQGSGESSSSNDDDETGSDDKPKGGRKTTYIEATEFTFDTEVAKTDKGVLVYFHKADEDLADFEKNVAKRLGGMVKTVTILCDKKNESAKALKVDSCPSYKFLKPGYKGKDKYKRSVDFLKPESEQHLLDQVKSAYRENAKPIDQAILQSYMRPYLHWPEDSQEVPKILVIYFHKDESDIRLAFKAITHDPEFSRGVDFITVSNPHKELMNSFQVEKLPGIGAIFPVHPQMQEGENDQGYRLIRYPYAIKYKILYEFLQQITPTFPEANKYQEIGSELEEIEDYEDFQAKCKGSLICGIGLFKDDSDQDVRMQKEVLQIANKKIPKSSRVKLVWVNGHCHNEVLKSLGVDGGALPTIAFYLPKQKSVSMLIGKFDSESVELQVEKLIRGSATNVFPMQNLEIFKKDCESDKYWRAGEEKSQEDIDLENQILREILEEEKAKKKVEKEEKKPKKKKGKKKKNKEADL